MSSALITASVESVGSTAVLVIFDALAIPVCSLVALLAIGLVGRDQGRRFPPRSPGHGTRLRAGRRGNLAPSESQHAATVPS